MMLNHIQDPKSAIRHDNEITGTYSTTNTQDPGSHPRSCINYTTDTLQYNKNNYNYGSSSTKPRSAADGSTTTTTTATSTSATSPLIELDEFAGITGHPSPEHGQSRFPSSFSSSCSHCRHCSGTTSTNAPADTHYHHNTADSQRRLDYTARRQPQAAQDFTCTDPLPRYTPVPCPVCLPPPPPPNSLCYCGYCNSAPLPIPPFRDCKILGPLPPFPPPPPFYYPYNRFENNDFPPPLSGSLYSREEDFAGSQLKRDCLSPQGEELVPAFEIDKLADDPGRRRQGERPPPLPRPSSRDDRHPPQPPSSLPLPSPSTALPTPSTAREHPDDQRRQHHHLPGPPLRSPPGSGYTLPPPPHVPAPPNPYWSMPPPPHAIPGPYGRDDRSRSPTSTRQLPPPPPAYPYNIPPPPPHLSSYPPFPSSYPPPGPPPGILQGYSPPAPYPHHATSFPPPPPSHSSPPLGGYPQRPTPQIPFPPAPHALPPGVIPPPPTPGVLPPAALYPVKTTTSLILPPDHEGDFKLVVRQQPQRARMCGFGEKDRRPIDPPPIVQLVEVKEGVTPAERQSLVLQCTLWNEERSEHRNIIRTTAKGPTPGLGSSDTLDTTSSAEKHARVMMGNIFANAIHLEDDRGDPGYFFIFPDLSIRVEGRYCLKFDLLKVIIPPTAPGEEQVPGGNQVVAEVYSDVFVVFAAKKFPGMMESTEFTKAIARQGIKINIRGEPRRRGTAAAGTTGGHGRESGRRRKVQVVEVQSDDEEEDEDEESEMSRRSAET